MSHCVAISTIISTATEIPLLITRIINYCAYFQNCYVQSGFKENNNYKGPVFIKGYP